MVSAVVAGFLLTATQVALGHVGGTGVFGEGVSSRVDQGHSDARHGDLVRREAMLNKEGPVSRGTLTM